MTYAPDYEPTADFSQDEANNVAGRSTVRTAALDDEFANLASCFNQMNANLKLMQRDDGQFKDFSVGIYALSNQLRALIATSGTNPRGPWQPSTAYAVLDLVEESGIAWICWQAFTSGASFDPTNFIDISGDGSAAISAADAAASALSASGSASSANSSAVAAATSATAAAASAISAANSATGATNSASSAASSAAAASSSKDQAASSASSAQTAQAAAEAAAADAQAAVLPGRLIDIQVFSASGTWTKPSGLGTSAFCLIEVLGAGGGGGGSAGSASNVSLGGGGTAGQFKSIKVAIANMGATEAVVVGASGAGGANTGATGSDGGNSSITVNSGAGNVISAGGSGGYFVAAGSASAHTIAVAVGPSASNTGTLTGVTSIISHTGSTGVSGWRAGTTTGSYFSGGGGNSPHGTGGAQFAANVGRDASGYGAGGGGACSGPFAPSTGYAGGAGSGGLVIVKTYS